MGSKTFATLVNTGKNPATSRAKDPPRYVGSSTSGNVIFGLPNGLPGPVGEISCAKSIVACVTSLTAPPKVLNKFVAKPTFSFFSKGLGCISGVSPKGFCCKGESPNGFFAITHPFCILCRC